MHRSRAALALRGLNVSVPRRATNVDARSREVDVSPLQAQHLARTHPGHGKNREHRLVWLGSGFDDVLHLFRGKESRFALHLNHTNFGRAVSPVLPVLPQAKRIRLVCEF